MYTYILNRWWQQTLGIGIALLAMVAGLTWLPSVLPQYTPVLVTNWKLWLAAARALSPSCVAIFLLPANWLTCNRSTTIYDW